MIRKKLIFLIILIIGFNILVPFAQAKDEIFKAKVLDIIEEKEHINEDGSVSLQQKIRLKGLDGKYTDKEIIFDGLSEHDILNKNVYFPGDKVLIVATEDDQMNVTYYITDYIRTDGILFLFVIFVLSLIIIGKKIGIRSIISLCFTFFVVIKYIIPQILDGQNPIIVTILGSLLILLAVVYITEGINKKSHIAVISIFGSLLISIIISIIFVDLTKLSGFAGEEMAYLLDVGIGVVNFKGLLLAGIIIGTLGVLDDVVVSQIVSVEQIFESNSSLSAKDVYNKAYKIGVSHISSMANTLFLAYAGASLPLLVLFVSGKSAFSSWSQIINNEMIATEIIRTLTGSVGLILAVPISTGLAVFFYKRNR